MAGGLRQRDGRTPLTPTRGSLLCELTKAEETADTCPVLSYKNVCFLSSLLYRSLCLYYTKLKSARRPPPCRHTWPHMAGVLAPPILDFSGEPQSACLPPLLASPPVLAVWFSHLLGLATAFSPASFSGCSEGLLG